MNLETKTSEKPTSYDKVPYESQSFAQTHPDRLATLGRLFGMSPALVTECRVLELGCACGGNLIPMAYQLPESEFVGVDLSLRQVEMGREVIQNLGLKNIRIEHVNILDIDSSWGVFDYIICHGVFSWVPDDVQEKILSICSNNLAPQGISYVSYNTYPGWHMREMIRHMMLYHTRQFEESTKRIEQARALMNFLANSVPIENNHYGLLLRSELNLIRRSRDSYLFHDHLEEVNDPVYFYQFAELADKHSLQYLGEADFSTMLTSGFPQETAETLRRISQNIISTEQYMDFIRNRFFRQTLLCHKGLTLKRDLGADDIKDLLVASAVYPDPGPVNLLPGKMQFFQTPGGLTVETESQLTKTALTMLGEYWPRALDLDTLFKAARNRLDNSLNQKAYIERNPQVLFDDLLHCYTANVIEFHTWQADFVNNVSEQPKVSKLAAYQNGREQSVVNQRHEIVSLDPMTKHLIPLLDGTCDRVTLLEHLSELVENGTLVVSENGNPLTNSEAIRHVLAKAIEEALAKLARSALLIG